MKTTYEQVFEAVIDYIRAAIKEHPIKDGNKYEERVYYMNGNDGTRFDWEANGRTCEFFVFYDTDAQLGYIKAYVTEDGNIEGFVWDTERSSGGVALKPRPLHEDGERAHSMAHQFMETLHCLWDCSNTWDQPISSL